MTKLPTKVYKSLLRAGLRELCIAIEYYGKTHEKLAELINLLA